MCELLFKQEELKDDDTDCIVSHDELTSQYEDGPSASTLPPPAQQSRDVQRPVLAEGTDNVQDGDLGLGRHDFSIDRVSYPPHLSQPGGHVHM